MKKYLLASAMLAAASSAVALDATGTAWSCTEAGGRTGPLQWCNTVVTSATTATQLGRVNVDANRINAMVFSVSGSAIAGLVSPTINYYVGNRLMASQTVSTSTTGNIVFPALGVSGRPLFTGITISQSQPALISSTNAVVISIQVNQ